MHRDQLHKQLIEVAAQSPAKKRKVGAIIAKVFTEKGSDDTYAVLAKGYNFNLSGGPCETEDGNTHENVIHAEMSCLKEFDSLARNTEEDYMLKMFITHPPCDGCKAALYRAQIEYEVMGDFLKFDSTKPRLALVPPSLIIGVAKVLTYGAKKYKVNNWRKTPDIESYISALDRHLLAWRSGEELDPESGLHHLEHAACNIAFLIELKDKPKVKESI